MHRLLMHSGMVETDGRWHAMFRAMRAWMPRLIAAHKYEAHHSFATA